MLHRKNYEVQLERLKKECFEVFDDFSLSDSLLLYEINIYLVKLNCIPFTMIEMNNILEGKNINAK